MDLGKTCLSFTDYVNGKTLLENRFLMSQIGNETGNCSSHIESCAGRCLRGNSVPANADLTLLEREIWCRNHCNMSSSGYFNLFGEPVGLGYGPVASWIVFYVIPPVTTLAITGCLIKIIFCCPSKKKKVQALKAKLMVSPTTASILAVFAIVIDGGLLVMVLILHRAQDHVGITAWVLAGLVDSGFLYVVRYVNLQVSLFNIVVNDRLAASFHP